MSLTSFAQKQVNNVYDKFSKDPSGLLLWAGVFGWILSSTAQVGAVIINKEIGKDQKKFLIPQEIADAAINISTFFIVTSNFKNWGAKLTKQGNFITKEIKDFVPHAKKSLLGTNKMDLKKLLEGNEKLVGKYKDFSDGIGFLFTTLGSVISCNIITPYLRNYLASIHQKRSIAADKRANELMQVTRPILPAHNKVNIEDYKRNATLKPVYPSNSSSLKI